MRNVLTIFKNDLKALTRHFFAFLIIIALLIIPSLYAWFNIYAFWDPYSNTENIKIAVVNNDKDYMDEDGKIINIGNELVKHLEDERDRFGFVVLDDADAAVDALYAGEYYAAVVVDPDFTYNMYNFLDTDMFAPTIKFYQNEKLNTVAVKIVEAAADSVKQCVNEKYIAAVVETMFNKLNTFSSEVRGNSSVNMIKATLSKLKENLDGYDDTVGQFISANSSLVTTLKNTNSTLNYSIYLIGSERININKQIYYVENTQTDLSKINEEVNTILTGMSDAVKNAIYKLDRLYKGEDAAETEAALAELEAQYQELIDFITHSGVVGTQAEDALSALNTVKNKITQLRADMGMDGNVITDAASEMIQSDYETVAVPSAYTALTGYEYSDLSDPNATQQSMDGVMDFMSKDADKYLADIQDKLDIASTTNNVDVRNNALTAAIADADIAGKELSALGTAFDAVETATGSKDTKASDTANEAAKSTSEIKDKLTDILNGNRDLDLIYDLQLISDAIGVTRVALTESVYPAIDDILQNVQDSLGDVSSILLDISTVIGKAQPIVSQLGGTFGSVNTALIQINDLVKNYSEKIGEILGILNGESDNDSIQKVLDFLSVDPVTIGQFFAKPVTVKSDSVYPVVSYGAAMAPFYTMLAIWVGCIVLNSVLKLDKPVELLGAKESEKFFGRYLIFFLLSLIQTLVIMAGDILILGVECAHPSLFLLTGVFTSLVCSILAYSLAAAFGNIGKALFVVIMIIQIAGSGGSYPIELLPDFFQQIYLFFPFPYAINAMREAIAGLYQNDYIFYILKLLIFVLVGLFIGTVVKRSLNGVNEYMNEQLEKTEMM